MHGCHLLVQHRLVLSTPEDILGKVNLDFLAFSSSLDLLLDPVKLFIQCDYGITNYLLMMILVREGMRIQHFVLVCRHQPHERMPHLEKFHRIQIPTDHHEAGVPEEQ